MQTLQCLQQLSGSDAAICMSDPAAKTSKSEHKSMLSAANCQGVAISRAMPYAHLHGGIERPMVKAITLVTQTLHGHVCTVWQHDVFVAGYAQSTVSGHC